MPITEEQVKTALMECYDPEIPVNIVDLGLIYTVNITPDESSAGLGAEPLHDINIDMTMTSPGCPSHVQITEQVKHRLMQMPGVKSIHVNLVWEPAWSPERLSQAARQQLQID